MLAILKTVLNFQGETASGAVLWGVPGGPQLAARRAVGPRAQACNPQSGAAALWPSLSPVRVLRRFARRSGGSAGL